MIDYKALKALFPDGLPEAHNVFATVKAHLTYQILRKEYGYAATNRKTWKQFTEAYAEATKPVPVASVSITGAPASLDYTKTAQLSATVLPANADNKTVTWKTSDATLATVSATGLVTALSKAGTVKVTATAGGKSSEVSIQVKAPVVAVTGVTMSPKTITIEAGKTGKLTGTVAPANATNKSVTYTSADTTKATVASDGTVTVPANLAADSTVVITVKTADGNKTDTATVTVKVPTAGV